MFLSGPEPKKLNPRIESLEKQQTGKKDMGLYWISRGAVYFLFLLPYKSNHGFVIAANVDGLELKFLGRGKIKSFLSSTATSCRRFRCLMQRHVTCREHRRMETSCCSSWNHSPLFSLAFTSMKQFTPRCCSFHDVIVISDYQYCVRCT